MVSHTSLDDLRLWFDSIIGNHLIEQAQYLRHCAVALAVRRIEAWHCRA
jgi:hypothetical protein